MVETIKVIIFVVNLKFCVMRTYFLKTRKTDGQAPLYTRIRRRKPNLDIWVNCLVEVDVERWSKASASLEAWRKYERTAEGAEVVAVLKQIDAALEIIAQDPTTTKADIDARVSEVVYEPEMKRKREMEAMERAKKEAEEEAKRKNVILFLDNFLSGIKDGTIKDDDSNTYSENTCKVWGSFRRILIRFYAQNPFTWDDINKKLSDKFVTFLEKGGYMVKTINKYLICFKAITNAAYKAGIHTNVLALTYFNKKKVSSSDKAAEIYLTYDELQKLYEMDLTGLKDKIRDVFLVGCYTSQRFSDYGRLTDENFTTTAKGTKVVKLTQVKTDEDVVVPILDGFNDNLKAIARKYDGNLPKVSVVVLNRYIKIILKELSESVPSLKETYSTTLTMLERAKEADGRSTFTRKNGRVIKPKYELVSSHTARRSGITNLVLSGQFNIIQMMSVSGHKDTKTFLSYVKLSGDEKADQMAKQWTEKQNQNLF